MPDNYQGIPAILIRATVVSSSVSSYTGQTMTDQSVSNIYLDTPMKNILGGTISSSVLGNTNYPITADTVDSPTSLIMLGCLSVLVRDTPLTYEGPQAVTVPAGTYSNADLYTHSASGVTTSYWIASGIPVKMQSTTETDVLTGWG
jgi:hypothetical protein